MTDTSGKNDTGKHVFYGPYERLVKRFMDMILSLVAIILLSPVMIITAFFLHRTDRD